MLNKVMLIGRLGKTPELKYTQSGIPVTSFSLATSENYTDKDGNKQEKTEWHTIIFFQKQAEICAQYLQKGSLIYLEGALQTRSWDDQHGQKRYTTEIKGTRFQFLERRNADTEGSLPEQNDSFSPSFPTESSSMDEVPF
ncbi:MAG: single-stranded DNA-binding protein [Desulfovibrionaceae bacterium]